MISVDTSVWIDFFQGQRKVVDTLTKLLDDDKVLLTAPVRIEILSGAPKKMQHQLKHLLGALPLFFPADKTWKTMEQWIEIGSQEGERFGAMDLLIGALTKEQHALLWSLDNDFRRMEKLGMVALFVPPPL